MKSGKKGVFFLGTRLVVFLPLFLLQCQMLHDSSNMQDQQRRKNLFVIAMLSKKIDTSLPFLRKTISSKTTSFLNECLENILNSTKTSNFPTTISDGKDNLVCKIISKGKYFDCILCELKGLATRGSEPTG